MHSTISNLALKQNKAAAKACCRFLCNTTISPRVLLATSSLLSVDTNGVRVSYEKYRVPGSLSSLVSLFIPIVRRRPKHWEKERRENSLARFIHAFTRSTGVASRFAHCMQLCKCDYIYMCMRACQLITWLRCFSTSSRNEVSPRDVTQNTKNEIRFVEHLRISNEPHAHVYVHVYAHVHFYSRNVVLTLVILHGEARIMEIRLPHTPPYPSHLVRAYHSIVRWFRNLWRY